MNVRSSVTAILGATIFLIGLSASATGPYRGIVAIDGLHFSNFAFAVIASVSAIGTAVVSLILGHLIDRAGDRRFGVLACAAFSALAFGLIFFAPSRLTFIVAFCGILPFGGALFSQTFSYSRAYFDSARPGHAEFMTSVLRTLFSLAFVVAPALVAWLAARYSVYGVFGASASAQVAILVVFSTLFFVPGTKIGTQYASAAQPQGSARLPAGRVVGIVGVMFLRAAIFLHMMAIPLVLTTEFGASLADVGFNAAACAILEIPFMLGWGHLAVRYGKEPIIVAGALIYSAYLLAVPFAHSVDQVLWLQGVNAIGTASLVSIPISYMQESVKGRIGLSTALFDVVTVVGQMAASGLFALFSTKTSYLPVMVATAVVSVLGAAAVGFSKTVAAKRATILTT